MHNADLDSYVLIITSGSDVTADHVLRRMADRGIPHLRLNAEKFGEAGIALQFPNVRDSVLSFGGAQTTISKVRGVWLRRLTKPTACQIPNLEARAFAEGELDFSLRWLIDLLGNYCPVLDPEARILEGRNKFDQLVVAENVGLRIPATLITNDSTAAKDFVDRHKKVAIKSVAGYGHQVEGGFYTIYTNIVTSDILGRFDSIRLAPVCLQEYIEKEFELRITVVGSRIFACRIDSQSTPQTCIDWRHYNNSTPHSIYPTDQALNERLIAIMRHYDIRFASFDLIVTPDGTIVFLEMNPATQFLWIEELTRMPITDAIIDEILAQCRGSELRPLDEASKTKGGETVESEQQRSQR